MSRTPLQELKKKLMKQRGYWLEHYFGWIADLFNVK
jgi:hypothetical protein